MISTSRKPQRKQARIPSYRCQPRPDGRRLAFVMLDGRRHYLGDYDTPESREQYHRLVAEWEASGGVAKASSHKLTVMELSVQFLRWARTYYVRGDEPTAEPGNIALAMRPLTQLYGRTNAADFGPRAIKAVQAKMIEKNWSRRYINRQVGIIKRMFKWAVAEELVPPSVYHGLQAVCGLKRGRCGVRETPPVQPVPQEFIEPVKQCVSRQVAAMIDLQLLTGARPGEIVIIRKCDIDRSRKVWAYRPAEHKTQHLGHERIIYIGPKAQTVLAPFLLRPDAAYCFSPAEADRERRDLLHEQRVTPLSCGNVRGTNRRDTPGKKPGAHYTTQSYGRAIYYGCLAAFPPPGDLARKDDEGRDDYEARLTAEDKSQIKAWRRAHRWHPHQLRHSYATRVRKEFNLEAAQILLGHSSADVTQIYAERDTDRAIDVALKIG